MQSEGAYWNEGASFKTAGTLVRRVAYSYNADGKVTSKTYYDATGSITEKYTYTENGDTVVTVPTGAKVRSRNDSLGRHSFDEIQTGAAAVSRRFEYHEGAVSEAHEMCGKILSSPTTNLVERISYSDGDELEYTYDKEERITSVVGKYINEYEYDCHGQLINETYTDLNGDTTFTDITYDSVGNILTKGGKTYRYRSATWFDLLTEYDGQVIRYDASGNPTLYLGGTMTWAAGRKLSSYADDTNEVYYTYNSLGQRIEKTVNGNKHAYIYAGHRLVKETITNSDGSADTLVFLYDSADSPIGMQYNDTAYYYKKNLQGDVIELLDASGETVAEYIYDAWGALREPVEADSIAEINPIRYRGYYYDNETGFYFLQSRYYDPVVGRFINADEPILLGISGTALGYNFFAYCENDPVNNLDYLGYMGTAIASFAAVVGAALGKALSALVATLLKVILAGLILWLIYQMLSPYLDIVESVVEMIESAIENFDPDKMPVGYCVYVLMRNKMEFGNVFYVGKTKNYAKRMQQHHNDPAKGDFLGCPVVICKDEGTMRLWEQIVLSVCIVKELITLRIGSGVNKIRAIAKLNLATWKNTPELSDIASLLNCKHEDDILYMMEA